MNDQVLIRFRLTDDEARSLRELSAAQLRRPRDQVRIIVRRELERLGYLQPDVEEEDDDRDPATH